MKNSRRIGIRPWKRKKDAKKPCAKKRERTNSNSSSFEETLHLLEAKSAETIPGLKEQSATTIFNLENKEPLHVFPIVYSNTRDNRCESVNVQPTLKKLFKRPVPKLTLPGRLRNSVLNNNSTELPSHTLLKNW